MRTAAIVTVSGADHNIATEHPHLLFDALDHAE